MKSLPAAVFLLAYLTTTADPFNMENENIIFVGRLLEMPSEAPRCGDLKVAAAYRFGVEKLVKGKTKEKTLVVLIPCPDLKGDNFFETGSRYQVEASDDLQEAGSYTIYNDYADRAFLWTVDITKLEEK
jgi:hypothetical protein